MRGGVLIKGGAHLENLGVLTAIAFDKTGTLTIGKPRVTDVVAVSGDEARLLTVAAAVESRSDWQSSATRRILASRVSSSACMSGTIGALRTGSIVSPRRWV